ncbi:C2 domain-containing protein 5-like [Heteronotia binoei]|uniref:C2 domain-containing protein 5-like n=1 Tax=Heteronotia binoei TaxID=13085 RepID=UPI00292D1C79|nr:C2 domain-containing protein 5-like [Heteronotia binoei]
MTTVTVTAVAITFDKHQALQTTKTPAEKNVTKRSSLLRQSVCHGGIQEAGKFCCVDGRFNLGPAQSSADNEEQLQFPLELSSDPLGSQPFMPAKEDLENASSHTGLPAGQRATSVDYSSFADRCNSWIEFIKLKAQTIRRGSIKTTVSLDKPSPLTEGQSRHRSGTSGINSTVPVVKMTPLSFIPGAKITKYLGIINMFFIRETTSLREEGGVSGFLHAFIAEVFAMVRAHVAALGGNAVVSYIMKQCVFMENPNKNQAQCLINVSGDAVIFVRESELDGPVQLPAAGGQPMSARGDVTT